MYFDTSINGKRRNARVVVYPAVRLLRSRVVFFLILVLDPPESGDLQAFKISFWVRGANDDNHLNRMLFVTNTAVCP